MSYESIMNRGIKLRQVPPGLPKFDTAACDIFWATLVFVIGHFLDMTTTPVLFIPARATWVRFCCGLTSFVILYCFTALSLSIALEATEPKFPTVHILEHVITNEMGLPGISLSMAVSLSRLAIRGVGLLFLTEEEKCLSDILRLLGREMFAQTSCLHFAINLSFVARSHVRDVSLRLLLTGFVFPLSFLLVTSIF